MEKSFGEQTVNLEPRNTRNGREKCLSQKAYKEHKKHKANRRGRGERREKIKVFQATDEQMQRLKGIEVEWNRPLG